MSEEIKEYTLKFHKYYERLAPNYGYETRKDTKEFDFNSNNGKLMYATVNEIISPLLQKVEQLENKIKYAQKIEQEYSALLTENTELENIRKEAIKVTKDVKQFVYDELVDRNVSGATETHCKIMDLLNILNKGDNK